MQGVFEHFNLPVGGQKKIGEAMISAFEFLRKNYPLYAVRSSMNGLAVFDGKFVRLNIAGELVMSDTDMERQSSRDFCINANGNVLIAGLGIGLVIKNILNKLETGKVTQITVIEKSNDVISLVSPYFKHKHIKYIHADILEWRPDKSVKYDTIYFDIWPTINTDNLKEIKFLHNVFKYRLNRNNPECWMNSWMKERLQSESRKDKAIRYW